MDNIFIIVYSSILAFFILLSIIYIVYLSRLNNEILKLEKTLKISFRKRSNLILAIYSIVLPYSDKTNMIFKNILDYRKIEIFWSENMSIIDFIKLESKIHYELTFIIQFANQIWKLQNNWDYVYIKGLTSNISESIWDIIVNYKEKTNKFNKIRKLRFLTIFWIFVPFSEKIDF